MVYLLIRSSATWYKIFLKGALIGGIFEYTVSLLQKYFLGTKSWDNSKMVLNIQGRTTIPIMLISWSALIRQTLRHKGIAPLTPIGLLYDKYYTNEFLKKYFANMKIK